MNKKIYSGNYDYTGLWGCSCVCGLNVFRTAANDIVVCEELPTNEGTSVTNFAESLATIIVQEFKLHPEKLLWLELYREDQFHEQDEYSIVHFDYNQATGVFSNPKWKYIDKIYIAELLDGLKEL